MSVDKTVPTNFKPIFSMVFKKFFYAKTNLFRVKSHIPDPLFVISSAFPLPDWG